MPRPHRYTIKTFSLIRLVDFKISVNNCVKMCMYVRDSMRVCIRVMNLLKVLPRICQDFFYMIGGRQADVSCGV